MKSIDAHIAGLGQPWWLRPNGGEGKRLPVLALGLRVWGAEA